MNISEKTKEKMVLFFAKTSIPRILEKQKRGELMDSNVGKKVRVLMPGQQKIERVLHEDYKGLFIRYKNQTIRVKPDLNEFGEHNTKTYIRS